MAHLFKKTSVSLKTIIYWQLRSFDIFLLCPKMRASLRHGKYYKKCNWIDHWLELKAILVWIRFDCIISCLNKGLTDSSLRIEKKIDYLDLKGFFSFVVFPIDRWVDWVIDAGWIIDVNRRYILSFKFSFLFLLLLFNLCFSQILLNDVPFTWNFQW